MLLRRPTPSAGPEHPVRVAQLTHGPQPSSSRMPPDSGHTSSCQLLCFSVTHVQFWICRPTSRHLPLSLFLLPSPRQSPHQASCRKSSLMTEIPGGGLGPGFLGEVIPRDTGEGVRTGTGQGPQEGAIWKTFQPQPDPGSSDSCVQRLLVTRHPGCPVGL